MLYLRRLEVISAGVLVKIASSDLSQTGLNQEQIHKFESMFPDGCELNGKALKKLLESPLPLDLVLKVSLKTSKLRLIAILQEETWRLKDELNKRRNSGHRPPENLDLQVSNIYDSISKIYRDVSQIVFGRVMN